MSEWRPIHTAPKDRAIRLRYGTFSDQVYVGQYRHGAPGEPQPREVAWREQGTGRFAHPYAWQPTAPDPSPTRSQP